MKQLSAPVVTAFAGAFALACSAAPTRADETAADGGLCAAAKSLVVARAAEQGLSADVRCIEPARGIAKDVGAHWQLAAPVPLQSGTARILLDAIGPHPSGRDVAVPAWISIRSAAWVAVHDVNAGSHVGPGDLQVRDVEWPIGARPVPARAEPPVGRARVALRTGDWVTADRLLPADEGLQGDPVTVQLHEKNLTVEAPGLLTADARVGHAARVQLEGQRAVLEGQLVDLTTVVVGR
jgi:flagella basal body P-ring formation protein FlgA